MDFFVKHHIEIAYIACAMLGGIMHWLKKSMNGETESQLTQWFGTHNLAATFYTLTVFFFAIVGSLAADIVNSSTSFWAAMYTGFVTGFAIDSGFNRDMRDVNRDLLETRNSMREMFDEDSRESRHGNYGNYSRNRRTTENNRGYGENDERDNLDVNHRETKELSVEERRAKLRRKLGTN